MRTCMGILRVDNQIYVLQFMFLNRVFRILNKYISILKIFSLFFGQTSYRIKCWCCVLEGILDVLGKYVGVCITGLVGQEEGCQDKEEVNNTFLQDGFHLHLLHP